VPSIYACYRFAAKLRRFKPVLDACLDRVTNALHAEMPEMGEDVAIDASDLPAYANGQRFVSKGGRERERFSDPDASWGHRSAVSTRRGAASTAIACTQRSALAPIFLLLGKSRRRGATSPTTLPP
jgi:hypothetical protein